jgi:hypothetical protein
MRITETNTFAGLFVTIVAKSGMEYTYIRAKPGYWVYQYGGSSDPYFSVDELETAYLDYLK